MIDRNRNDFDKAPLPALKASNWGYTTNPYLAAAMACLWKHEEHRSKTF